MKSSSRRSAKKPFVAGFLAGILLGVAALLALGSISDRPLSNDLKTASVEDSIPAAEGANDRARPFTLIAVGDILLARRVGSRIAAAGWQSPFVEITPLLSSAELTFANLECPASYLGTPFLGKPPVVTFRADPGALLGLKKSGIDVVSLANNHLGDYGSEAVAETLDGLDVVGVAHGGAGRNEVEARRPAILDAGGRRIAVLAYVEPMWSVVEAKEGPGVAVFDPEEAAADIVAARAMADLVLVSLHWGEEHSGFPRESDREIARMLVDAGADAILGHHPHVLQGAEFYRGKPIFYSLGNFVFDMVSPKTYESAAAVLSFERGRPTTLRFIPLRIDTNTFAPAPAEGEDEARIGRLIRDRSAMLGSPSLIRQDGSVEIMP
jgi:poly-gamma-glutamate capsule biosynthesis protein CapA/YwtB (metallophosphatase superfamily)